MAADFFPFGVNYFYPPPETKQFQTLNYIAIDSLVKLSSLLTTRIEIMGALRDCERPILDFLASGPGSEDQIGRLMGCLHRSF